MDLREEIFSKNFRLAGDNAYNKEDVDAFFDKFFDAFEPVSYTHLDVYKRQAELPAAFHRTAADKQGKISDRQSFADTFGG